MSYYPKMTGSKCYLSPMNVEDVPLYTKWLNDIEVIRNMDLSSLIISEESERDAVSSLAKEHNYAIVEKVNNTLIGNCGLTNLNQKNRSAEVGIFIGDKVYWGKGYGAEALGLLLEYAFNYLNLRNIMLRVFSFNERGFNCYKKIGFKEIGRRRKSLQLEGSEYDEIYMDILNDEFRQSLRN